MATVSQKLVVYPLWWCNFGMCEVSVWLLREIESSCLRNQYGSYQACLEASPATNIKANWTRPFPPPHVHLDPKCIWNQSKKSNPKHDGITQQTEGRGPKPILFFSLLGFFQKDILKNKIESFDRLGPWRQCPVLWTIMFQFSKYVTLCDAVHEIYFCLSFSPEDSKITINYWFKSVISTDNKQIHHEHSVQHESVFFVSGVNTLL